MHLRLLVIAWAILCIPPVLAQAVDDHVTILHSGTSTIEVILSDDQFTATHAQLMDWIQTGIKGVTKYFGQFPVKYVRVVVSAEDDGTHINGAEYDGELIRMDIGRHVSAARLADDWTMTHEMLHLGFPYMGEKHHWMNEGLSVYLEPVVRARMGIVSAKRYWKELHEGLENGQPEAGDRGLDLTHTWGRTYWGGTIFWFLADTEIRRQTHGEKSVDDVVRKILADGGDGSQEWTMDRVLNAGDGETKTRVLHDLYQRLALKPDRVSFDSLWKELGVRFDRENVDFDDNAPLAWMRKAILAEDGRGRPPAP